ncbi:uncharacterized protein LOC120356768 isoform X2 [Solenopsis invicta]|uniref:uncharacterized protein LOC120356768 isoform X2 n=1 Tax=Solenopsis invicta TaxID=13686 RepID=UPI00193E95AB|nr:uncharacterized protein LOC120356768 isoform X2 [Solenopsis invicta]
MEIINIKEVIHTNIDRYSLKEIQNIIKEKYQRINNQLNANDYAYIERKYIKYCLEHLIDEINDSLSKHVEIENEVTYKKFIDVSNIKSFNEILSPFNESKYYKLLMKHHDLLIQHNEEALLRRFKNKFLELLLIHIDIVLKEIDFLIALVEFLDMYEKSERHLDMTKLQYLALYADISNDEFFKAVKNLIMSFNAIDHDLKLKRLQITAQLLLGARYVTLMEKYKEIIGVYFKPITVTKLMIDNRAVIEIKGGNFRLSDKQIANPIKLLLSNDPNIEEVRFICSGIIYVDADFENCMWHGKNIVVYAKAIRVCDTVTWDVSGKSATSLKPCKAGTAEDGNGINGECGESGENGGNVFIHANNIFQPQLLFIKSNGGDGSDGQSGGDGNENRQITLHTIKSLGTIYISWLNGKNLPINNLIKKSSESQIYEDIYIEAETKEGHRIYFSASKFNENLVLYKGSVGQPGGRGGMGGLGGQGGHAGKIIGCSSIIIIANVGRNGKNGATGKHGNYGRNGWDMAYISYEWDDPTYYGKDENTVLELNYYDDNESDSQRIYIPYRKYIKSKRIYAEISSRLIPKPTSTDFIEKEELSIQIERQIQVMTKKNILPDSIFAHYFQYLIKINIKSYQNFKVQMENLAKQILEKIR